MTKRILVKRKTKTIFKTSHIIKKKTRVLFLIIICHCFIFVYSI